jgi:hypothetical protein
MHNVANLLRGGSDQDLRAAIAADLALHAPDVDAYQKRLHTATILRAIHDMKLQ